MGYIIFFMFNLAILIPAYNEEKRIGKTLDSYSEYFENLRKNGKINYDLIVIINNTFDDTEKIVKQKQRKNRLINYINLEKGGKGFAITAGFKKVLNESENDLIGFVDADMSTRPEAFYDLILKLGNYDGVIASRYLKGSLVKPKPPLKRIIVSRIFNKLIRVLLFLPYKDTQCGAKVFRRNLIEKILPKITFSKWAYDVDLLYNAKKKNFKIIEVPTIWSDKEYSKINFMKSGPWMVLGIIRLRLINSPLRFLIGVYDKTLFKVHNIK
ncbi:TPA: glycosyltransferase [Candidatus Pacearchaeota archaeon]|nr:glycosyltransferase [Candidatus Pacearchaeota archaeon]